MDSKATKRVAVGGIDETAKTWLQGFFDDSNRSRGRIHRVVLRQLADGEDPSLEDVVTALQEFAADTQLIVPPELLSYAAKIVEARRRDARAVLIAKPRKPGRKTPPRSAWHEARILEFYEHVLTTYREMEASQGGIGMAKKITAKQFNISKDTVDEIVRKVPKARYEPSNDQ